MFPDALIQISHGISKWKWITKDASVSKRCGVPVERCKNGSCRHGYQWGNKQTLWHQRNMNQQKNDATKMRNVTMKPRCCSINQHTRIPGNAIRFEHFEKVWLHTDTMTQRRKQCKNICVFCLLASTPFVSISMVIDYMHAHSISAIQLNQIYITQ